MKRRLFSLLLIASIFIPCLAGAEDAVILGRIAADKEIDALSLSPNTGIAYGIREEEKSLYIFDLKTYALKKEIKLDKKPKGIAVNPLNNLAYITSRDSEKKGSLQVIDADGDILNTITIPKDPQGIAINPNYGILVIAIEEGEKLLVLSLDTFVVTQEIPLPRRPRLVSLDRDSNRAVVVAGEAQGEGKQDRILIVDINAGAVLNEIKLKKEIKAIAADEEKDIAVVAGDKEINLIDVNTGSIISTIHTEDTEGVDINQATHNAVIAKEHSLLLVDLDDNYVLKEYYVSGDKGLKAVAVDKYRNTCLVSSKKDIIEIQLPNPVPEITSLIPDTARAGNSGFTLKVLGKRFITTSAVQFNQKNLSTTFVDNNTLEASVPSTLLTAPGTVPVTVTNPPPEGGASEPYPFAIKYSGPVLTTISPDSIPAKSPDFTLKAVGSNFMPGCVINLNGQDLATSSAGPSELNAVVPSSLITTEGSYPVIVMSPERYGSNILYLTVKEPLPKITAFTPKEGVPGAVVTITGENFNYLPRVSFAGTQATALNYTPTEIKTVVPMGARTGQITVTTKGGSVQSTEPFTVVLRQDFVLNVNPQSVSLPIGGNASFIVTLSSTGSDQFTGLVKLSTAKISGITTAFEPEYISVNQSAQLKLTLISQPQATQLTISGTSTIDGVEVTMTATAALSIVPPGTTSLTGQVLATKDEKPIKGVTLKIGTLTTVTDDAGNFIFIDPPAGEQVVVVDGHTGDTETASYPSKIPVPVVITGGQDNKLPYQIYLHEVNTKTFTVIDPGKDTVVTDAAIPDFQMFIPAGTVIMGYDGNLNDKISVAPVAVDRLPIKAPPEGVYARTIFMYYFFKPGGGIPNRPVPVVMPNEAGAMPGERVTLWYYDESFDPNPNSNQWKVFGNGTVSPDGKSIVPDPGIGIPKFCCGASFPAPPPPPPPPPPKGDCPQTISDPVDPRTGVFYVEEIDMSVQGIIPMELRRIYRTRDNNIGSFGRGTSFNWGDSIYVMPGNNQAVTMVTQAGAQYIFSRGADGAYTNSTRPYLKGTSIARNPDGTLTEYRKDGSIRKYRIYTVTMARLYQIIDKNGNIINLDLNDSGNPVRITDSNGRGFILSWSGSLITSVKDHTGRTVTYTYDANNLVIVTNPEGGVTKYAYDAQNRMVSVTDPRGITQVVNEYDANNRVTRQTNADGGVVNFEYFVAGGNVTAAKMTDPNGNTTSYRFRSYYTASITNPYGQTTYYDRDYATNLLMAVTDPLGRITRYTYDQNGNTTSIVDPAGNTTIIEYDQTLNEPVKVTDPLGNVQTMEYDPKGNLTSITDPLGNKTTITNIYGKPASITDALGNTAIVDYDEYMNLVKVIDPLGNTVSAQYDTLSRLTAATSSNGRTTTYFYDRMNRTTETRDPVNGVTKYTYDPNGNLLTVTDAKNQTMNYTYNLKNKVASMTDQLGNTETHAYDQSDNLISVTDRRGKTTTYTYDKMGRVATVTYGDGSYTHYTYDAVGRLIYINDSVSGPIQYIYSNTGCSSCGGGVDKVMQEITPQGSINYTYDALGRRTSITVAGEPTVNYEYDAGNRLIKISTLNSVLGIQNFDINYDALGRRTAVTRPNAVTTNYAYNNISRLLNLEHLNSLSQVLESLKYSYDANGNITSMQRVNMPVALPDQASDITYSQANRMLTFTSTPGSAKNITYDENGNMTSVTDSCGTTTYAWDARNRLVGISGFNSASTCGPVSATFKYDALGRRIEKTINGGTIQYLYDVNDIVQEIEGGTVTANYIRTLNIDEPLARIQADGTVRYYQADALGSIIALTDETGSVKTTYTYDPFGNVAISGETSGNPFQYTGRENDGTGLYNYRARYYSPELQRFISEDPIGLGGGINFYAYVGNNPIRYVDPFGLSACEDNCRNGRRACRILTIVAGVTCNFVCTGLCTWATGGTGVYFCRMACAVTCAPLTAYLYVRCDRAYDNCMNNCRQCPRR